MGHKPRYYLFYPLVEKPLLVELFESGLEVDYEVVCYRHRHRGPDHNSLYDLVFPILGKRVSRHLPAVHEELVLHVVEGPLGVNVLRHLPSDYRQLRSVGENGEVARIRYGLRDLLGNPAHVVHDGPVALHAEAHEVVILAHDLGSGMGEVDGDRVYALSKISYGKAHLFGKVLGSVLAPYYPAYAGVNHSVLVAGNVDGVNVLEPEVPGLKPVYERSEEAAVGGVYVNMDGHVFVGLVVYGQLLVQKLDVVYGARVGYSLNSDNSNGVFVDHAHGLVDVHAHFVALKVDLAHFHVPVGAELLPHDLVSGVDDEVGAVGVEVIYIHACLFRPVLPGEKHGQASKHASFGGAYGGGADEVVSELFVGGDVPHVSDHGNAVVFDGCGLGVFGLVYCVGVEGLSDEPGGLGLHLRGAESGQILVRLGFVEPVLPYELFYYVGIGGLKGHEFGGHIHARFYAAQ